VVNLTVIGVIKVKEIMMGWRCSLKEVINANRIMLGNLLRMTVNKMEG
jgi:hypothetical protein